METLLKTDPRVRSRTVPAFSTKCGRWLKATPEALKFVEKWLDMASVQESPWTCLRVHKHLVKEFACPISRDALRRFCQKGYPEKFEAAMSGIPLHDLPEEAPSSLEERRELVGR